MIPYVRDFDFEYGRCDQVSPLVRRIIARNPGPFTFTGTGTYIVGKGDGIAVIEVKGHRPNIRGGIWCSNGRPMAVLSLNSDLRGTRMRLPAPLAKVDGTLQKFGMGGLTADLESRMNRAAEIASPKAGALCVNAIQKMTVTDAQAILTGSQDSATQYLRKTLGPDLAK